MLAVEGKFINDKRVLQELITKTLIAILFFHPQKNNKKEKESF